MKKLPQLLLIAAFGLFTACSKSPGNGPDNPNPRPPGGGTVTEAGVPDGTPPTTKVIGAAGGELASHDGALKVIIPAGALSGNQTVKIQRISSKNPLGAGPGYRLEPHGVKFAKPVTLTLNGGDSLLRGTVKEALGIAYRNEKGVWVARPGAVVNTSAKTVSVTTTHFSDWEMFKGLLLFVEAPLLDMGTATRMQIYGDMQFLAPLVEEKVIDKDPVTEDIVRAWKMSGTYGKLTPNGNKAMYAAPNYLANAPHNPVAISAELKGPDNKQYLLIADITVTAGSMSYRNGGGLFKVMELSPALKIGNVWKIANHDSESTGIYFGMQWPGTKGTFHFSSIEEIDDGNYVMFNFEGSQNGYISLYVDPADKEETVRPSRGSITITSMGDDNGGYVTGSYIVENAGIGESLKSHIKLEGKFRVLRQP